MVGKILAYMIYFSPYVFCICLLGRVCNYSGKYQKREEAGGRAAKGNEPGNIHIIFRDQEIK